jgi:hypothetical protein
MSVLLAEIDHMEFAGIGCRLESVVERLAPGRNHGQRIGKENSVEACHPEQVGGAECCGVALRHADTLPETSTDDALPGGRQHLGGDIEAEQPRFRVALRRPDQVATGAASDFEDRTAPGRVQLGDEVVPAEQVVAARKS